MRIIGFLIRLALVLGLVIWLADRPGTAQIEWRDYAINMSAAVLAVIILALAYAAVLLHRLWRFIWDGPRFWKLNRKIGKMQDGHKELSKGLAAIAAGHPEDAGRHAVKARKLMGETPLSQLIQAQAAQIAGDHGVAKAMFERMTADPETAILGYRGLIMGALRRGDYDEATRVVYRLEQTKVDVPWLHLVRFEMGARMQNWLMAGEALAKARKGKALPPRQADRHEAALLLATAKAALRDSNGAKALESAEKARKLAPDWLPAALVLAEAQIVTKHERAALRTIERAWGQSPHPQLIPLLQWAAHANKPIDGYKQVERLTRNAKDSPVSLMALAEAALKADLWGEARRYLLSLVGKGEATQLTYQMLARLERREKNNEAAATNWLAKAITAQPDPQWLCAACGAAHEYWTATCDSCDAFNRLTWNAPGKSRGGVIGAAKTEMLDYLGS